MKRLILKICNYLILLIFLSGCAYAESQQDKPEKNPSPDTQVVEKEPVASIGSKPGSQEKKKAEKKAARSKQRKGIEKIKSVLSRYRQTSGVSMSLKKTVYLALMETEKTSSGKAILSKGRFRLELEKPDKSLLVMSPETLWIENEFNGDIQVSKVSMSSQQRKRGLIGIFFDQTSIWDGYRLIKAKTDSGVTKYTLKPLKTNKTPEAEKVEIDIHKKKKKVVALTYWDELENKTTFEFKKVKFSQKFNDKEFRYTPPKGVEVTEY